MSWNDNVTVGVLEIFVERQRASLPTTFWPDGFRVFNPAEDSEKTRRRRSEKHRAKDRERYRNNPLRRLSIAAFGASERRKQLDRERYLRIKEAKCLIT